MSDILLMILAFIAGFIDSIAGGGGLITVPSLSIQMGPGVAAIATNKMAAVCASLVALLVYLRSGHVEWRRTWRFALIVGLSSSMGALTSPKLPPEAFKWLLMICVPGLLWIVWKKDIWVQNDSAHPHSGHVSQTKFIAAGILCGFYDGIIGPGGGTLMFLSLLLILRQPLLVAMASAKLANLASAGLSLLTYGVQGHVHFSNGIWAAIGISFGAFVGASFATRKAAPLARLALLTVSILLLVRLWQT